jgi:hypothetical protein
MTDWTRDPKNRLNRSVDWCGAVLDSVRERLTGRNRYCSGPVLSVFAEFRAVTNGN